MTAVSKGKGFAGGMKRHNFKGQGASHGNHKHHRAPGSVGACATPARVFKGTRMAGQMGYGKVTTLNLEVVQADAERNLLLLKGAVPGPRGGMVLIRDADQGRQVMALPSTSATSDGAAAGSVTLDEAIFGIQPNVPVLHQVVTAQLAAARSGTQSTKTRAEVSGGGRKPFKQKGTGRARQGSERAPHFTGGGVALGPKPRSYRQRTPRKMIQLALRSALSDRAAEGKVVVVELLALGDPEHQGGPRPPSPPSASTGKVLVVLSRGDEEAYKSFRNLPEMQLILTGELNAYDVLCNDWIVFTPETLPGRRRVVRRADGGRASRGRAASHRVRRRRPSRRPVTDAGGRGTAAESAAVEPTRRTQSDDEEAGR